MILDEAIQNVIKHCPNPYAVIYAENMDLAISEFGEEGKRVQCLYILSNIVDLDDDDPEKWTGKLADEVVKVLRQHSTK